MASVLVTGGSGFCGSLLVTKLLEDAHDVTRIDPLPSAESRGYVVAATCPGGLEWKGYVRQDDTLILFMRRSSVGRP